MSSDRGSTRGEGVLEQWLDQPAAVRLRREIEVVADLVDTLFYVTNNPSVQQSGLDPVEHFCRHGWRELRKPSADFDVWWYGFEHMDGAEDELNPLVHFALIGRAAGLSTRPQVSALPAGRPLASDRPIRRAVLFAGFDADGVVDPSVIELVTDLNRHGDVFYLFDGQLAPSELAKLDDITAGAWAARHGSYDFGSYSRLAATLVGWDRLQAYDEVVFVNDSCFLLRPLDDVFAAMESRACDWWGLQATRGMTDSQGRAATRIEEPIPLHTVRAELLEGFEQDPVYSFHLGSYFLAFRRPVIDSPVFRRFVESVTPQTSKRSVVLKYEIGLSHLLIGHGFAFDTYVDSLYPFHPLFSEWYFALLDRGFPLMKRFFVYRNVYQVPGLARWKERLLEFVPGASVDLFEQTLLRTAPDDQLRHSLAIRRAGDGQVVVPQVVRGAAFTGLNRRTDKHPNWWVFAVDPATHRLPASSRAIFEAVKDNPDITKIVLTRARRLSLEGANVVVEPLLSPAGRDRLLQSGAVFVARSAQHTLAAPVDRKQQTIVMVRDGLLLERTGRAAARPVRPEARRAAADEAPLVHPLPSEVVTGLLVASDVDQLAALATHWPASFEDAWRTGIPAHDFLLCADEQLPVDLRRQASDVRDELGGRRLLLFAPTRRRSGTDVAPYPFTPAEIESVTVWCRRNDFVLGLREDELDLERAYSQMFGATALDVSHRRYPSAHAVLRVADAVLTDYSGLALDFAVTGRPVLSFAHDLDVAQDRLLYDLDHFFPGEVARTFAELESSLTSLIDGSPSPRQARVRDLLVDHRDGRAAARVLERLATLNGGMGL